MSTCTIWQSTLEKSTKGRSWYERVPKILRSHMTSRNISFQLQIDYPPNQVADAIHGLRYSTYGLKVIVLWKSWTSHWSVLASYRRLYIVTYLLPAHCQNYCRYEDSNRWESRVPWITRCGPLDAVGFVAFGRLSVSHQTPWCIAALFFQRLCVGCYQEYSFELQESTNAVTEGFHPNSQQQQPKCPYPGRLGSLMATLFWPFREKLLQSRQTSRNATPGMEKSLWLRTASWQ